MKKLLHVLHDTVLIVLGVLSAAFGLKGFLLSSHFIDGGVTGVSMLLSATFGWPLSVLIIIINLPFIALGFKQIGRAFAFRGMVAIALLGLCLAFVKFPDVTSDKLLTAVFGGFFLGAGIGMAIRGGAVLDGTEIAALLVSKASSILRVGDVILLLNIVIFLAAVVLIGVEPALYSILTYFAASKTIDFILHGVEEYHAVLIVSDKSSEIRDALIRCLHRGVTVYQGRGGMSDVERHILMSVVTRLEIGRVKNTAREIDPHAFIMVHSLADAEGGVVKRRLHA